MTCDDFKIVFAKRPFDYTNAEILALRSHARDCTECRKWTHDRHDAAIAEMGDVTPERRKELLAIAAARVFQAYMDPEAKGAPPTPPATRNRCE